MALALGEDRDQHIGAGHFLAARRLDVNDRALDDALEAGRRFGIFGAVSDEIVEFGFEIGDEAAAQLVEIDIARPHDRRGVLILDQREQQMFQRRVFVVALIGERQRPVQATVQGCARTWAFQFLIACIGRIPPGITFFP